MVAKVSWRGVHYQTAFFIGCILAGCGNAAAADYRVEPLKAGKPEGVSPAIAEQLGEGIKIVRGSSRTVCEIWWFKEWSASAEKPAAGVLYPFTPGQMVGVLRFPRKSTDFRNHDIGEGTYTLRYALQPVDGAHVGTSATRDFLLLTPADIDAKLDIPDYKTLTKQSGKSVGASHPALLSLQKASGESGLRHDEQRDWWLLAVSGKLKSSDTLSDLQLELVVVGHADE